MVLETQGPGGTQRWLRLQRDPEAFFATVLEMTARAVQAPVAVISIITASRYQFRFAHGLSPSVEAPCELPFIESPCRHVAEMGRPLIINDVLAHPLVRSSSMVSDLGIAAYLGEPMHDENGKSVGSFCVFDRHARDWTEDEVRLVSINAVLVERALNWPDGLTVPDF